jgi:hypothetical protein
MNNATDSFRAPELLRRDGGLISATPAPHFGWDEALTTDAAKGPRGTRPTNELQHC